MDEKRKLLGNFENFWWKFYRKFDFLIFYFNFGKFVTKNRTFGNNTIFLQQFFRFRGDFPLPPPGYALEMSDLWGKKIKPQQCEYMVRYIFQHIRVPLILQSIRDRHDGFVLEGSKSWSKSIMIAVIYTKSELDWSFIQRWYCKSYPISEFWEFDRAKRSYLKLDTVSYFEMLT